MKEYDCRICGETFAGLDKRNQHEKLKHTKRLDEFGISIPDMERPEGGESDNSEQISLEMF